VRQTAAFTPEITALARSATDAQKVLTLLKSFFID